jgi:hypothetical protein
VHIYWRTQIATLYTCIYLYAWQYIREGYDLTLSGEIELEVGSGTLPNREKVLTFFVGLRKRELFAIRDAPHVARPQRVKFDLKKGHFAGKDFGTADGMYMYILSCRWKQARPESKWPRGLLRVSTGYTPKRGTGRNAKGKRSGRV